MCIEESILHINNSWFIERMKGRKIKRCNTISNKEDVKFTDA